MWEKRLKTYDERINLMPTTAMSRRTEMRSRYFTRDEAQRIGWNIKHPQQGGNFLEENEVVDFFPEIKGFLGLNRPDFAIIGEDKRPAIIVECKADANQIDKAVEQAVSYAEAMSQVRGFDVRMATGIAGTPDKRIFTRTVFRVKNTWEDLSAHGFPLTQLPTPSETLRALERADGKTDIQLPDEREFFDAAVQISNILRLAKIEEGKRPVVIGAVILALWQGSFSFDEEVVLGQVNGNVEAAIRKFVGVSGERRQQLAATLRLGPEADGLKEKIDKVVNQLERLNIRSIMRSEVDFLGQFYENFLRYGCDTTSMGIVFTPRHITRFCAELLEVGPKDKVYDPACGTGGFLVAAFDRMMQAAYTEDERKIVKSSIYGADTNSTVWALAMLNMFFRGDGKSHIDFRSAFDGEKPIKKFDKVLLNPPFSQEGEPEIDFVDHALDSLVEGGLLAVVVKSGIASDKDLATWRRNISRRHQILGVFSLPPDLFYPTAAPTVILVIRAHVQDVGGKALVAIVRNDGFEISKKKRVKRSGSQLPALQDAFRKHVRHERIADVAGFHGMLSNRQMWSGDEICAERWLKSEAYTVTEYEHQRNELFRQMALAVTNYNDATDVLIPNFEEQLLDLDEGDRAGRSMIDWFIVSGAKSKLGVTKYPDGSIPYVSSSDAYNSVVGLVQPPENEIYETPVVTYTAFGQAALQPWQFCARGNGGSAVKILEPAQRMTIADLLWLVGQMNAQRWRFHYGRMATKGRIEALTLTPPPDDLASITDIGQRMKGFRASFDRLLSTQNDVALFAQLSREWKEASMLSSSVAVAASHPSYLRIIGMGDKAIPLILAELRAEPDHWFAALVAITGQNPVSKGHRGRLELMAADWLNWGQAHGYE